MWRYERENTTHCDVQRQADGKEGRRALVSDTTESTGTRVLTGTHQCSPAAQGAARTTTTKFFSSRAVGRGNPSQLHCVIQNNKPTNLTEEAQTPNSSSTPNANRWDEYGLYELPRPLAQARERLAALQELPPLRGKRSFQKGGKGPGGVRA